MRICSADKFEFEFDFEFEFELELELAAELFDVPGQVAVLG